MQSRDPAVLAGDWPHALHILGYLYRQELEDARMFWKSIPSEVLKDNPELEAVWKLLQYSWNKHYQGIWQALQGYPWSPQLRPLVDALVVSTRDRMMQLLSQAYSLLSPAKAASLLGVSEQEAAALAEGAGWRQDMESGMFITQLPATVDVPLEGFDQLRQLAEYVVHLESS